MTGTEFAELVDWILDRDHRAAKDWNNSPKFFADFSGYPAEEVWSALFGIWDDPKRSAFYPSPREVHAAVVERIRHHPPEPTEPALPDAASGPSGGYRQWSTDHFGDYIPLREAIRRRHAEIEGIAAEELGARLPSETGMIEDGMKPRHACRSPHCEIHREEPIESEEVAIA